MHDATKDLALLERIKRVTPRRSRLLDDRTRSELTGLTTRLLAASPGSAAELERYLAVRQRSIDLPDRQVGERLRGRVVLVTGGSGCIGRALLDQLARFQPARVVVVSLAPPARPEPGVEHYRLDIRDGAALTELVRRVLPDVVFHLAAQRDPGLAERAVHLTVTTNVLGTRNLIEACARAGVGQLVYASTGKALRPYSSDVYAATKRASESLVADAAARGALPGSAVRFTHVVDNSIVLDRFLRWCRAGEPMRLHSVETMFYVQSALESAQLLLAAALSPRDDLLRVHAIRDLGWPFNVLHLALGVMAEQKAVVPLQVVGHEPGYEKRPYPGLYDPALSGGISPLLNALEAPTVQVGPCDQVDVAPTRVSLTGQLNGTLERLDELCAIAPDDDSAVRAAFDDLAWGLLERTLRATPRRVLRRVTQLTAEHRAEMSGEHLRMDDLVRSCAGLAGPRARRRQAAPADVYADAG